MYCPICQSENGYIVFENKDYPIYIKPIPKSMKNYVPLKPLIIKLCNNCGHVYQDVSISIFELSDIYEKVYASYHSPAMSGIGVSHAQDYLSFLGRHIDLDKLNVLEIGCYDGYLLKLLQEQKRCHVIGCDPSPGAKIARTLGIDVVQKYYSSEIFSDTFGLVILRCVLEHIQEPVLFLREICKVIKDDGFLAIEVPDVVYSLKNGVLGDFFHEHISYFTKESAINALKKSGFNLIAIENESQYIRIVAKKINDNQVFIDNNFSDISHCGDPQYLNDLFVEYNRKISSMVSTLRSYIMSSSQEIYIYGGGGHTLGLLARLYDIIKPVGVIDGDPSKKGKLIPGFQVPVYYKNILEKLDVQRTTVIISTEIYQEEIFTSLLGYIEKGLDVITLYPTVRVWKSGEVG